MNPADVIRLQSATIRRLLRRNKEAQGYVSKAATILRRLRDGCLGDMTEETAINVIGINLNLAWTEITPDYDNSEMIDYAAERRRND